MKDKSQQKKSASGSPEIEEELWKAAENIFPGGILGTVFYSERILEKAGIKQIFIPVRGEGANLWDMNGNCYLDYTMGMGTVFPGHCHPRVVQAVQSQVTRGSQFISMINEPAVRLAEAICRDVPAVEKLRFASTGAEAVHYAIRVARAFTGRSNVLRFEGAYHGNHDLGLMSYLPPRNALPPFPYCRPDSAGILEEVKWRTLVGPFNDIGWVRDFFKGRGSDLAAVVVEPIQRFIPGTSGFLKALREETEKVGA